MRWLTKILLGSILFTLASYCLPLEPADEPEEEYGGPVLYVASSAAYDANWNYVYSRDIYIWVMPPHKVDGYPAPTPKQVRDLIGHMSIHSVDAVEGAACDINAPVINEYVGQVFAVCMGGVENQPVPFGAKVRP